MSLLRLVWVGVWMNVKLLSVNRFFVMTSVVQPVIFATIEVPAPCRDHAEILARGFVEELLAVRVGQPQERVRVEREERRRHRYLGMPVVKCTVEDAFVRASSTVQMIKTYSLCSPSGTTAP